MMQHVEYSIFPLTGEGAVTVLLHMMLDTQQRIKMTAAAVRTVMFRMKGVRVAGRRGVHPMTATATIDQADTMTDMMVRRTIDMMMNMMPSMMTDMMAGTIGMMTGMMAVMIGTMTSMIAETAGTMTDQEAARGTMKAAEVVEGTGNNVKSMHTICRQL